MSAYAGRSVPMDVVLGRERTKASQVIKQADVAALLELLPEEFAGDAAARNFAYYEPRCSHGSSLSRVMHGFAAARLGHAEVTLESFHQSSAIDLADTYAAIDGGVHIAALGGIWSLAVLGFAGLLVTADGIALDPHLPRSWNAPVVSGPVARAQAFDQDRSCRRAHRCGPGDGAGEGHRRRRDIGLAAAWNAAYHFGVKLLE